MGSDRQDTSKGMIARRSLLKTLSASTVGAGLLLSEKTMAQAPMSDAGSVLDVAIIGGGLSGLTSGRDLRRAGN